MHTTEAMRLLAEQFMKVLDETDGDDHRRSRHSDEKDGAQDVHKENDHCVNHATNSTSSMPTAADFIGGW